MKLHEIRFRECSEKDVPSLDSVIEAVESLPVGFASGVPEALPSESEIKRHLTITKLGEDSRNFYHNQEFLYNVDDMTPPEGGYGMAFYYIEGKLIQPPLSREVSALTEALQNQGKRNYAAKFN